MTISSYTGDGTQTDFDITFDYRDQNTVKVEVDGAPASFTFISASRVSLGTAPTQGANVKIFRETPVDNPAVVFEDGAIIRAADLNASDAQARDRAEELGSEVALLHTGAFILSDPGLEAPRVGSISEGQVLSLVDGFIVGVENDPAAAESAAARSETALAQVLVAEASVSSYFNQTQTFRDQAELFAGQALSASSAARVYSNDYASALPHGVTDIEITAGGSGYTDGTYAGGVTGGPTGFAWSYTVTGGAVDSVTIDNAGLATTATLPTLDFPSGGGTGATADATVSPLIPDQDSYWAATADGEYLGLWMNDGGALASVDNPSGGQVEIAQASKLAETIAGMRPFAIPPTASSPLFRLVALDLFSEADGVELAWPEGLGVRELDADGLDRFRFRLGGGDTLDAEGAYPEIAKEVSNTGLSRPWSGLTKADTLELYAADTRLGVPAGTHVGNYRVDFAGTAFGTYYHPTAPFPHSEAALIRDRILPTDAFTRNTTAVANEVAKENGTNHPFMEDVADPYLFGMVEDISIDRGVPGRNYILRYRTDFPGANRFRMNLYDPVLGVNVAYWAGSPATADDLPEFIHLTGAAAGGPMNTPSLAVFTGTSATVRLKRDGIDFSSNKTNDTVTDVTLAGIKANRVRSPEQTHRAIREGDAIWKKRISVSSTGDFARLDEALASLLINGADQPRGWYPFSDSISPSYQVEVVVDDIGHVEEFPGYWVDQQGPSGDGSAMGGQGMIIFEGVHVILSENTRLYTYADPANGGTTPLFEFTGGRISGPVSARLEQLGGGYVAHKDMGNSIYKRAFAGPAALNMRQVFVSTGLTYFTHSGHDAWMIGCGESDGADIEFRDGYMTREDGSTTTAVSYGAHTSPDCVIPEKLTFTNMTFDDEGRPHTAIGLITRAADTAQTARHEVIVNGCKIGAVGMSAQYRPVGNMSGAAVTVDGSPY